MFLGIHGSPVNLVLVEIDSSDVAASKARNFSRGSANAAAHVKNFHASLDSNLAGEIMLMSGYGVAEWFPERKSTKVKGSAPSIFVNVGR